MALADTAKLVASLELQDRFSRNADKFGQTVGGLERQTSTLGRIGGEVSRGLGTAAHNLQTLGVIGIGIIGANVAAGIRTLVRLEEVTAATNAVIASTGGVAGITAEEVRNLAEKYEGLNATMDDKVIQSAENLLLTFTNITDKAFEPALEAALNMNQAMGGGEEGLQRTIIQLGKALQDPIRGATALRRAGVNLSRQQQDQIKLLVEQNNLYGAQRIILDELTTEFGGAFAAAGDTAAGRFAKFRDSIEDAQAALATAFLPVLGKVADKLSEFLADPATLTALEEMGTTLADAFDQIVEIAGELPWTSIGDAFRLMGTGSKALLDAFLGLPPWVQTAVLTGWGLNKLTGGALTSIVGALSSGLIRGILGINAGVVNVNAATVNAPGVGAPVAGAGRGVGGVITRFLGLASAAVLGAMIGSTIGTALNESTVAPARTLEENAIRRALNSSRIGDVANALAAIQSQLTTKDPLAQAALLFDVNGVRTTLEQQRDLLRDRLSTLADAALAGKDTAAEVRESGQVNASLLRQDVAQSQQFLSNLRAANAARGAEAARSLQQQAGMVGSLQQIARKPTTFTVNTSSTVNIDGRKVAGVITKNQLYARIPVL